MRLTRISFLFVAGSAFILAADKPNFTGTWEMNKGQSDFGQMGGRMTPDKLTQKITQKGDAEVRVEATTSGAAGNVSTDMKYKLDGSESANKTPRGEVKSVAKWDGNQIAISTKREVQGMSIAIAETWEVSVDGKTLTVRRTITGGPAGDVVTKVVFDKQ